MLYFVLNKILFMMALSCLFWLTSFNALASTSPTLSITDVNIAVLSLRSKQNTLKKWQATADYLSKNIQGYHFNIRPMLFKEIEKAAKTKSVDFILTNSAHQVTLKLKFQSVRMVTLVKKEGGLPIDQFSSVIFTRSDRKDINTISDLKNKHFMAVDEGSLGGFLAAWDTLLQHKIAPYKDLKSLRFSGLPHDKVVFKVLKKEADAGTVRTGIIESLIKEGKIRANDLKILGEKKHDSFPFRHSAALYPEWPLIKLKSTSPALSQKVFISLINMSHKEDAALKGKYYGWSLQLDYSPVRALMQKLRAGLFKNAEDFNMNDVIHKYFNIISFLLFVIFYVAALFITKIIKLNRSLNVSKHDLEQTVQQRTEELRSSKNRYQRLVEQTQSDYFIYSHDAQGIFQYVSPSIEIILGYKPEEFLKHFSTYLTDHEINNKVASLTALALQGNKQEPYEIEIKAKDGSILCLEVSEVPAFDKKGEVIAVEGIAHDITQRKNAEREVIYMAQHDLLTSLANRRLFEELAEVELRNAKRNKKKFALLFLDLDGFKAVNDAFGHAIGDDVLKMVAKRLLNRVRESDIVSRFGGDEFVILLSQQGGENGAQKIADAIIKAISLPFILDDKNITIGVSVGVTLYPNDGRSIKTLMQQADEAMYQAKLSGKNCWKTPP